MYAKNKQKNKKTKNTQTNSPPKLDTPKSFCILPLSKTNSTPLKKNKQDSHISFISSPFCHVLTKTTQTKSRLTVNMREKREPRKQMNPALQRIETTPPMKSDNSL